MYYLIAAAIVFAVGYVGWKMTSRSGYESAEYTVLKSDGSFEIREYPDLMLVTTSMSFRSQGNDGSFGRLFRYISGGNESEQKVAMTTPVFMEPEEQQSDGQMAFVLPAKVAAEAIPSPSSENVKIRKRPGGRFAALRFAGRIDDEVQSQMESKLRTWIQSQDLAADPGVEFAGYDPPWTPGPLRRNEVLIRLK